MGGNEPIDYFHFVTKAARRRPSPDPLFFTCARDRHVHPCIHDIRLETLRATGSRMGVEGLLSHSSKADLQR